MFTGIIQEIGQIGRIEPKGSSKLIIIECSKMQQELKLGDSIACDGICLTVIAYNDQEITLEAMAETSKKTTLKNWFKGYRINLEKALGIGGKLDGHLVQGHIDTVAEVLKTSEMNDNFQIDVELTAEYSSLVVDKGSVAVNGVSLTVASLTSRSFTVAIVAHTREQTNLSSLKPGSKVNVEFDIIGKYVTRYLMVGSAKISEEMLIDKGF